MKKLGLIFVVFLCFSLFLVPNKSFAQGNEDLSTNVNTKSTWDVEKNAIVQKAIFDMSAVPNYNQLTIKGVQNQKLQEIADSYFRNAGANTTYNTAAASIYAEFGRYLASTLQSGVRDSNDIINAEFSAINNLYTIYNNAAEVEAGRMSTETEALKNAEAATRNANIAKPLEEKKTDSCSLLNGNLLDCAGSIFTWFIKTFLLNIAGFLVWLSANMLNYSIQVGILNFSKWAPDTLYPIWIVIRQIVSLFIVFAGLYLGLMYIIGKDEKFEKYIPWVVIFALFVNFSYPLARTAIDVSNVISLNIYASAVGNDALTGTGKNTAGALIMNRLGLKDLVFSATKETTTISTNMVTSISSVPGALMAVLFVVYAAYIFFMVTALIIMRTVALVFLTIASPILFVDSVIPKLGDKAVELRKIFFEQLAVGPIFMIMLALTLKFLDVFSGAAKTTIAGSDATIVEFFNIAMMLIMLHIMLKVTKETAGSVGQMATNAMGKVGGFAGGMALGGAGMLGRAGIGRLAAKARDSGWMTSKQGGMVGRHMYNMTDSIAKSSFDARNLSYVQSGANKLGMGLGMGSKMGFEEIEDARNKNLAAHLGRVGTYSKDVYDSAGNLEHKKGSVVDSEVAREARQRYIDNAGGAMIGKDGAKGVIKFENKSQERSKTEEIISEYKKIEDGKEKREFFAKQTDAEIQKKLVKADANEAYEKQDRDEAKADRRAQTKAIQDQADAMKALLQQSNSQPQSSSPTEPDRSPTPFSEAKGPLELEPKTPAPTDTKTRGVLASAGF